MKFIVIVISSVILIAGFVIINSRETIQPSDSLRVVEQYSDPLQVVEQYCELSERGDYEKIRNYTTPVPQEYFDAQSKVYEQSNKGAQTKESGEGISLSSNESDDLAPHFLKIINEQDPKLLNRDAVFIREIKNVWTKGNEARVEVELGSRLSGNYLSRQDFLLYRKDNEWKVFMIEDPPLVSTYGKPNQ